ncbi:MAG: hypothetical protein IJ187_00970 [Neisseriaceae bacterium]|nr:hypothetical protein [Neisseriaceae bacterium]
MKIERKILVFLLKIEVSKRKIAEFLGVSRTTLYEYLRNNPITQDEFNAICTDREKLIGYFWKYLIDNDENTLFRLPENIVNQKNNIQSVKEKAKTATLKSSKKSDEIQNTDEIKDTEKPDTSYLRQLSNDMAKEAQKYSQDFNK